MGFDPISLAALTITAVGTATSISSGRRAAAAQREATAFQQKQANLQNARTQRDTIRQARMAWAQAQQAAENQGVSGSSSSQGGLGSIASQLNDNLSFLDQYGFYSDQASRALGRANKASASADMWGSIANTGMTVFNNSDRIRNVFSGG